MYDSKPNMTIATVCEPRAPWALSDTRFHLPNLYYNGKYHKKFFTAINCSKQACGS